MLTMEVRKRVASKVVQRWRRTTNSHLGVDEVRSEAMLAMEVAMTKYDPTRGALEPYLYVTAMRTLTRRLTRLQQPAGSRSNDDLPAVMQLRSVEFSPSHAGVDPLDYDALVLRTQLRARMMQLAETQAEGELVLSIMLEATSVHDQAAGDKTRATCLYNRIKRLKKKFREDEVLASMMAHV